MIGRRQPLSLELARVLRRQRPNWQGTDSRRGSGLSRRRGLKTGVAFQVAGQIRGGRNVQ